MPRYISPLADKPSTRMSRDKDGLPVYTVNPAVLTPLRAKAVDQIKLHVQGTLVLVLVLMVITSGFNLLLGAVLALPAWILYMVVSWAVTAVFRCRTEIRMSVATISRTGWSRQHFDRKVTHSFVLYVHDKAQKEQRQQEEQIANAGAKGKVLRLKPYYADSYHVCLMHGTTRRDLVEVYSIKDAEAILQRLALCDALLNEAAGMGTAFHGAGQQEDRGAGGFDSTGRDQRTSGGF